MVDYDHADAGLDYLPRFWVVGVISFLQRRPEVEAICLGLIGKFFGHAISNGVMMVLTASELTSKGIVIGAVEAGMRPTTYDATVGSIIKMGREIKQGSVTLKPREILWLVSAESFKLGYDVTGLATLKTSWTHQGVLALNVGIVDPGWEGPLATAVVNLSSSDFDIGFGMPFLRLLFHRHEELPEAERKQYVVPRDDYVRQIMGYSKAFSDTFLDMNGLSRTVADQVLGMPRWGLALSVAAAMIGLLAISIPVGFEVWSSRANDAAKMIILERKVQELEDRTSSQADNTADCQIRIIDKKPVLVCGP